MSNITAVTFPKRLNNFKLSIYYLGDVDPPRDVVAALDDVLFKLLKPMVPINLLHVDISNYNVNNEDHHTIDITLKINNNYYAAAWLEFNKENWLSITKAFNGTFNYRLVDIVDSEELLKLKLIY